MKISPLSFKGEGGINPLEILTGLKGGRQAKLDPVAGYPMVTTGAFQLRLLLLADVGGDSTSGMETAAGGGGNGAGHFAGQQNYLSLSLSLRVRYRDC